VNRECSWLKPQVKLAALELLLLGACGKRSIGDIVLLAGFKPFEGSLEVVWRLLVSPRLFLSCLYCMREFW
jgi:hypothetical protein